MWKSSPVRPSTHDWLILRIGCCSSMQVDRSSAASLSAKMRMVGSTWLSPLTQDRRLGSYPFQTGQSRDPTLVRLSSSGPGALTAFLELLPAVDVPDVVPAHRPRQAHSLDGVATCSFGVLTSLPPRVRRRLRLRGRRRGASPSAFGSFESLVLRSLEERPRSER